MSSLEEESLDSLRAKNEALSRDLEVITGRLQSTEGTVAAHEKELTKMYSGDQDQKSSEQFHDELQPVVDTLLEHQRALAAAEAELEEDDRANVEVVEMKRERLKAMQEETARMLDEERHQKAEDQKFIDDITRDMEEYERTKSEERQKSQRETGETIGQLRSQNDLLRAMIAKSQKSISQTRDEAQEKENFHQVFSAAFQRPAAVGSNLNSMTDN